MTIKLGSSLVAANSATYAATNKKVLTTNATTCPTSRNYCVTSELLLVLFKKVKDSFIKEKKMLYNWVGPKPTFHH